jgi:heterokaryon incompatibility protein (HET)
LYSALLHLQYSDIAPAIWIDSVCINQNDDAEKSDQVQRLSDIYTRASRVIVWLGERTATSDYLAEAIHSVGNAWCWELDIENVNRPRILDFLSFETINDEGSLVEFLKKNTFHTVDVLEGKSVSDVLVDLMEFVTSTTWFYRVWIIQEYAAAKRPIFQIGLHRIDDQEFVSLCIPMTLLMTFHTNFQSPDTRPI